MSALQTLIARALVRLAIWAAPADQADKLRETDRLIWRPQGGE